MVDHMKIVRFLLSPLFTALLLFIFSLAMLIIQLMHGSGYLFSVYFFGMIAAGVSLLFVRKRRVVKSTHSNDRYSSNIALTIQYVSVLLIFGCTSLLNNDTKYTRDMLGALGFSSMLIISLVYVLDVTKEREIIRPFFGAEKTNASRR